MAIQQLSALIALAFSASLATAATGAVDLSQYQLVGRYALPDPSTTVAPANNLLAQEASAVTWNRNTNTLFITGDGGTSIVQVSLSGALINSMTLGLDPTKPQGTAYDDPEGLTYVGGGQFILVEERDRVVSRFTYTAGTTLNFAAGTASNGSASTANSVNLFNPALTGLLDFADVFALSNLSGIAAADQDHLLILSQESGKIIDVDRAGVIYSSLTIPLLAGTGGLNVADQQHEGMTMDDNGVLYTVAEYGGGDINHPELWVYAPVPEAGTGALLVAGLALTGISSIGAGESVIFIESAAPARVVPAFISLWFGASAAAGLQIGTYSGAGAGLSTGGDAVNLFDGAGAVQASVSFGASPAAPGPLATFDNAAGLTGTVSSFSVVGVNGAFAAAADAAEIGSPGTIAAVPEAGSLALMGLGLAALAGLRRSRR